MARGLRSSATWTGEKWNCKCFLACEDESGSHYQKAKRKGAMEELEEGTTGQSHFTWSKRAHRRIYLSWLHVSNTTGFDSLDNHSNTARILGFAGRYTEMIMARTLLYAHRDAGDGLQ